MLYSGSQRKPSLGSWFSNILIFVPYPYPTLFRENRCFIGAPIKSSVQTCILSKFEDVFGTFEAIASYSGLVDYRLREYWSWQRAGKKLRTWLSWLSTSENPFFKGSNTRPTSSSAARQYAMDLNMATLKTPCHKNGKRSFREAQE